MVNRVFLLLLVALTAFGAAASAGQLYYYDADQRYWEYWDGDPPYKVLVPALIPGRTPDYLYLETQWGGRNTLQISLGEYGPLMVIGTLPTNDPNRAWSALSASWAAMGENARTTTNSEITTDMGLTAAFRVLEVGPASRPTAMVRMVAFRKGDSLAYLLFVGNSSQYGGDIQQHWLKAVHSFIWR